MEQARLVEDLERIGDVAASFSREGDRLAAVLAAEPSPGSRSYLCAYEPSTGGRGWLVLDGDGSPVLDRGAVRTAAAIAALCEVAAEHAALGDLDELRAQLVALRLTDAPPGIDDAEEAAAELQRTIGVPPQLASPERLDRIGTAVRKLELALDPLAPSPFAAAMQAAQGAVDEIVREVESAYRRALQG